MIMVECIKNAFFNFNCPQQTSAIEKHINIDLEAIFLGNALPFYNELTSSVDREYITVYFKQ